MIACFKLPSCMYEDREGGSIINMDLSTTEDSSLSSDDLIVVFNSSSSSLSSDSELDVGDKSFNDEPPSTSQDGCSDDPLSQPL